MMKSHGNDPKGDQHERRPPFLMGLFLACLAIPATAQQGACVPREKMILVLSQVWGERHHSDGLDKSGQRIEVWTNDTTFAWTILATDPEGLSCILMTGAAWQSRPLGVPS